MSEKDLQEIFRDTEEVCFILTEISLSYLRYVIVILDFLKVKNIKTDLILIKGFNHVYPNFYSKFYWDRKSIDAEKFLTRNKESYKLRVRVIGKHKKKKNENFDKQSFDAVQSCNNSIISYLSTHKLKTEDIKPHLRKRKIKKLWEKQEKKYYDILRNLENDSLLKEFNGKIIFLNGRFPDQSAIKYFCKRFNKSFLSLEAGMPPSKRMHLSTNQTAVISEFSQDLASQIKRKTVPIQEQIEYSEVFLQKNMTDKNFNHHLSLGKEMTQDDLSKVNKNKVVTIFTSTIGEFIANNGIESYGWDSQYDALENTVKYLLERNYHVLIRMHPNSARFSWRDIRKIFDLGIDFHVKVYLPWEQVNSYDLAVRSEFVFTWGSTIGLEASALGKKTYIFSPTYYSLIADVRVFSPQSLLNLDLENWTTNRSLAMQAIYISNNHGIPLDDNILTYGTDMILKELDVLNASYSRNVRQVMKKSYFFSASNLFFLFKKLRFNPRLINFLLNLIIKILKVD
jgi:hypothetical protein